MEERRHPEGAAAIPAHPPDPGFYDLFVSYSTRDNQPPPGEREGWVQVLIKRVRDLAKDFTSQNLTTTASVEAGWETFYAPDGIHAGDAWETRLRTAIAHSRVLLACLSEHYWGSKWCRFEWETYLAQESARGLANVEGGITPIYIATAPGVSRRSIVDAAPDWAKTLLARRQVRLIEFATHGLDDLARIRALHDDPETARSLQAVADRISSQLDHAHRAERLGHQGNLADATSTFVGRLDELHAIEGQLFGGGALGVITALRGLGGQGKTALALRYGQNLRSRYLGGTWQVVAEGARELLPLLATLRENVGLAPIATEDDAGTARRVLAELHRRAFASGETRGTGFTAAALLVVDNVDDPGLIGQPQLHAVHAAMRAAGLGADYGWLHLLATTRLERHQLPASLKAESIIPVDALPEADALALWTRLLADEPGQPLPAAELAAARAIITLLERHTLAVEITARHLRRSFGETAASHLARLRAALVTRPGATAGDLGQAQTAEHDLPGYTHALRATLDFTFQRLHAEQPAALTVLHYAAHFPAEAVPLPWLRHLAGQDHPELLEETATPGALSEWDKARLRLSESLRLLTHADGEAEEIARLHRLAAEFLRHEAQQAGEDEKRVGVVEGFIDQRTTLAEQDHRFQLQPWERSVLLADLPIRVAKENCSSAIAQSLGVLIDVLGSFADLGTARRLMLLQNEAFQRHIATRTNDLSARRDFSVSLDKLGNLAVAQGDLAGAMRSFTESKTIRERLAASDPANARWQRDLSVSLERLGDLAVAQGDLFGALRSYTKSKTIAKRLAASDPANARCQRDLCVALNKMGDLAVAQGDLAGAMRSFTESKMIAERLAESDPANAKWQRDLCVALNRVGDLAETQGDLAGAMRYITESKTIAERLAVGDPANADWQRDLAVCLEKLGDVALKQSDLDSASVHYTKSKDITSRLAASDPDNAGWQRTVAVSHFKLCQFAQKSGDYAMMQAELQACFTVLDGMKRRGMHLDPASARLHTKLLPLFTAP